MTDSNRRLTDELIERLRAFFNDDAIVELAGLVAFQNLSSKFNSALDVPAQGFCRLPRPSPQPVSNRPGTSSDNLRSLGAAQSKGVHHGTYR